MRRKIARFTVGFLILLTLFFIFGNSLRSQAESAMQSESVNRFLNRFITSDTPFGSWVHTYIRKIAHFSEYALLGGETAVFLRLGNAEIRRIANATVLGLLCGFADETIQIFTGRGPAILDVWIDFSGFLICETVILLLGSLIRFIQKQKGRSR